MGALFMCLIYRVSSPNDKCLDVQVEEALEPQIDPGRDHHRETLPSLIESRTATSALSAESTLETESLLVHKNGELALSLESSFIIFCRSELTVHCTVGYDRK